MVKRESTSGTGFGAEGPMFKDYKGRMRYASQLQPSIMNAQFFPHLSNRSLTVILMQEINEENATCSFCFIYFQLVDCIVARFITHYVPTSRLERSEKREFETECLFDNNIFNNDKLVWCARGWRGRGRHGVDSLVAAATRACWLEKWRVGAGEETYLF